MDSELNLEAFDAGLLNDFGGGNTEWWLDYIRSLLGQAHEHYQTQANNWNTRAPDAKAETDAASDTVSLEAMRLNGLCVDEARSMVSGSSRLDAARAIDAALSQAKAETVAEIVAWLRAMVGSFKTPEQLADEIEERFGR